MFSGSMVALVTPMYDNGEIDYKSLSELVEWHIASKTTAIIATGTTGECATLDPEEQYKVIEEVVNVTNKRIPVIAGTGSNSTRHTIFLTELAKKAGADATLIVSPYYNKPPQHGLIEHYKAIAETVTIPIILYNVPSRTASDILPETVEKLSRIENIVGIKEATGNVERTKEILDRCAKPFDVYSGDDLTGLDLMLAGAKGVISVTANIAPVEMQKMCEAVLKGDVETAKQLNDTLLLLHQRLFLESNPIPTKWLLNQMGKMPGGIRLPLVPLSSQYKDKVKEALESARVTCV